MISKSASGGFWDHIYNQKINDEIVSITVMIGDFRGGGTPGSLPSKLELSSAHTPRALQPLHCSVASKQSMIQPND